MINETEIMIGGVFQHNANWCYRSPSEIKPFIFQWEARDWYALGECTMSLDDCEPIPITPEILDKCGMLEWSSGNWKFKDAEMNKKGWSDKFNWQ
jgi:hypothetical protein